ncbi:hypothetical protein DPMN_191367 [Dreissena polymorpha]|uniref:Uncharacterized protein n=1 Tax=Dreissena polymorpha TaxID=45954 RepID=A0A9D4BEP4_DREPO|nr:hypothetical protein DPMN_191367 [Dreissena polymorpha]
MRIDEIPPPQATSPKNARSATSTQPGLVTISAGRNISPASRKLAKSFRSGMVFDDGSP